MIRPQGPFAVQADWIVPVESEPIPNGLIVVCDGTIQFLGNGLPSKFNEIRRFRLDGFAILPGLINCHCHLEFSDLNQPIPAGKSFPDWIRNLIAHRNSIDRDPHQLAIARRAAITSGILESYRAGVRWVVDMTTAPWEAKWIDEAVDDLADERSMGLTPRAPICVQPCIELLDVVPERFKLGRSLADKQIDAPESKSIGRMGYAPHAPYTASRTVTKSSTEWSRAEHRLVTMHLAESMDEMNWIANQQGPFAEFLGPLFSRGYLQDLGQVSEHVKLMTQAWRAIIAHGNYLSLLDLNELAGHNANCAIVHCSRTHQFFGHRHGKQTRYPLAERMAMGVKHLLATDSRASNPDLSIWNEAKRVRVQHPEIQSRDIIKMITTEAAKFLCIQDRCGSVCEGQPSTLTAVKLATSAASAGESARVNDDAKLYDLLLASDSVSSPLELAIAAQLLD